MSKCTNQCQSDLLITKCTNSWFIVSRSAMHVQPMINIRHGNVILCIIVVHMNDLANVVGLVQLLARYLFV